MSIEENIARIKSTLPGSVTLVAVSKTKPVDMIREAYNEGIRDFGENKVQELMDKYECFGPEVKWHFIGHLQRNKVKYIVGKVYLIHSLDSVRLLNEIEKQYGEKGITAEVLIQINIGNEDSKTGILKEELPSLLQAVDKCSFVKVKGLMAIIPIGIEEDCRYYFKEMAKIFKDIKKEEYKNVSMEILSMGMTDDYTIAVSEGSNMVRIGEGIFGKRNYNTNI